MGRHAATPRPSSLSRHVEAFLEMMAAERGAARRTLEAYRRDLADLAAFLAASGTAVEAARPDDLRRYFRRLAEAGMAPRTTARRLSALRQFHGFLLREGRRPDDPTAQLDGPRLGRPLPKLLSEDEVAALIAAAEARPGPAGLRLRCIIELLYAAGLRISELLGLPLAAAAQDRDVLIVRGKGEKERLVPLNAPARRALAAYREVRRHFLAGARSERWLFPSPGAEGHLTRQRCFQLLRDLAVEAGLDPRRLSPHVMRHAFASHLLEHDADLRSVQEMLGHADIATTEIYTHVGSERLKALVHAHHPLARKK